MTRWIKAAVLAVVTAALGATPVALADGGEHDHVGAYEYEDADCTPVDDAVGDDNVSVLEEREHHGNGRTECVLLDGAAVPGLFRR